MFHLCEQDIYLFHQGTNYFSQQLLGCHALDWEGRFGYRFVLWAPHAVQISLVGDFNQWRGEAHPLERVTAEGLWACFYSDMKPGQAYKFKIISSTGDVLLKADPYAVQSELRPESASIIPGVSAYEWKDDTWQKKKKQYDPFKAPISIYEVHFGSWKIKASGAFYTYQEMAELLVPYVKELGFTHIELLPLAEHPLDLSWGYQATGYFSVTSRYGDRDGFKYFIDVCHMYGIGVIMDWVPGHFCKDDFGLRHFDGQPAYEYRDPKKAEKPSWGTLTFDFGRPEVQCFLISNALFWLQEYHLDGIRVDAVASMLYLNFDRPEQEEKIYNAYGGEENLEAYALIRKLHEIVFLHEPGVLMMAEDSSDQPLVTSPVHVGGLGFNYKWNMGWMNDMLSYMKKDPVHRKWHHQLLTFSFMYTFNENFLLPLSHDEVVHGKKSLLDKMPGDQWQQFANLRLLYGYMICHPGKSLLFMGGEFGQYAEWKDQEELDWHLLDYPLHRGMLDYVRDLNHFYLKHPQLFAADHDPDGFEWIDPHNVDQSIIAFRRRDKHIKENELIIICNFTPNVYYDYKIGVPESGIYQEIFNSDNKKYGGSGQLNETRHFSFPKKWHGLQQHIKLKIPPLSVSILQMVYEKSKKEESL